jgi:hypothetical protein
MYWYMTIGPLMINAFLHFFQLLANNNVVV